MVEKYAKQEDKRLSEFRLSMQANRWHWHIQLSQEVERHTAHLQCPCVMQERWTPRLRACRSRGNDILS